MLLVPTSIVEWPTNITEEVIIEETIMTWVASYYDYDLEWLPNYSKSHRTCALRIMERYWTYKVCNIENWKCIECYHNDYWPKEYTKRLIDLSSYWFSLIGNKRHWLFNVTVELVE